MAAKTHIFAILVVFLTINAVSHATISKEQIKVVRQLPVDKEYQDDLIQHFDEVRAWIYDLTLSQPQAGHGRASVPCLACRVVLNVAIQLMRAADDIGGIVAALKALGCGAAEAIGALHPDVCTGAIDMYADDLHYIIDNNPTLKAIDMCTVLLGQDGADCEGERTPEFFNWVIEINGSKPNVVDGPYLPDTITPIKILQLTDIHLDLDYEVGKNTDCGKPMCCQNVEAPGVDDETSAGNHGDYKCDMPLSSMYELFEYSATMEDYDYEFVMMTGDIPPHNIWNTTLLGNLDHYQKTNDKLLQLFPVSRGIPVYPVLGNHEPHPCNLYPPASVWGNPSFDKSWMYNAFADAYADHIKDPAALAQFRQTGYYTIQHKDTNLRIIVINTNFGYTLNFWLFYELKDIEGQLQWLSSTLSDAERAGDRVYILGHMPTGSNDCWTTWSAQFERIIVRYESIIMGQFYGHTHNDEIEIFYDSSSNPPRPANSLYIGASTTAYTYINPGFKVYYADGSRGDDSTWEIMDHETWIYNLTEANANVEPNGRMPWELMYQAKEAFGLRSLRPKDLDDLAYRMLFDDALFQKYYRFYHKDSHTVGPCTTTCKLNYICKIVIANSGDNAHCDRFRNYFNVGSTTPGSGSSTPDGGGSTTVTVPTTPDGGGSTTVTVPTTPDGGGSTTVTVPTTPDGGGSTTVTVPTTPGSGDRFGPGILSLLLICVLAAF